MPTRPLQNSTFVVPCQDHAHHAPKIPCPHLPKVLNADPPLMLHRMVHWKETHHCSAEKDMQVAEDHVDQWLDAVIEIPSGSRNKYEFDHERNIFRLDRVLYSSVHYPTDYGFIPDTLADDGDPLDILVVVEEPTFPGCYVRARPIGTLVMSDEKGLDEKILAVLVDDPRFDGIETLTQLHPHWLREIENFFATYKALQDKVVTIQGWESREVAWEIIHRTQERFRQNH